MTAPAGIVWLASFPKSGNTWFRILLANLAAGENGPADINDLDERGGIASSRDDFESATMLDSGLLSQDDIDCLRPAVYRAIAAEATEQRWIKVHDAYTMTNAGEPLMGGNAARAAVYLVRDPRDVAVSFAHQQGSSIDEAIAWMNDSDGALGGSCKGMPVQLRQKLHGWSRHVTSWLDQTDVPVLGLRYEDLIAATAPIFASAIEFAGDTAVPEEIDRAVAHSTFEKLRRQEAENGFGERRSRTAPFFRSGRSGGWRDTLTTAQRERIERCHGAVMARLGYDPP